MRFTSLALISATACFFTPWLAASADAPPLQGYKVTIGGRAHIQKQAAGTLLTFNGLESVSAVVPFGYMTTFPGFYRLDGRWVEITGVVDGNGVITLTDPDQLRVMD